jgi:uncharacterized protein
LAFFFFDTSALVKFYIREPGTDQLVRLAEGADHNFVVLSLTQVEFRSAIRKRERMREIDANLATELIGLFEDHFQTLFDIQPIGPAIYSSAKLLVDRYALRAYDAVQLAGCLELKKSVGEQAPTFVCADRDLLKAAESEGLDVLNPTD